MKEVAIELRHFRRNYEHPEQVRARRRMRFRPYLYAAAVVAAVGIAAGAMALFARRDGFDPQNFRFKPLATDFAYEGSPAWSADGKSIAYIADVDGILQVFVRAVGNPVGTQFTRAARDCREPFWDPSGDRIYYISLAEDRDALWAVGTAGGSPEVVLQNVHTAAISPDGKTLAFLRETGAQGDFLTALFTSSPVGAEPKQYTTPPLGERRFAGGVVRFAPDGSKIAVWGATRKALDRRESRPFFIVPYPTGEPYQALPGLANAPRAEPFAWMSDSRNVVLSLNYPAGPGTHLWLGDTHTGRLRRLTMGTGSEYYPAVSPDGRQIVFGTEEGDFDLVRLALDTGAASPLHATSRNETNPVWSPLKGEYAYVTNRTGTDEIWLRSQDGAWERPVVTATAFRGDPTFLLSGLGVSPDGQRVAYQRRGDVNFRIWISPITGGPAVPLIPDDRYGTGQSLFQGENYEDTPTWSPDGSWIAYIYSDLRGKFKLAKMKVGGESSPTLIQDDVVYPSDPHWSPRGDWITIETREGLALISPDGTRTRLLSEETWMAHTWSGDGSLIYGIKVDDELHLILAAIDTETGDEKFLADLGRSAPTITPVRGLSMAPDGKSLATSVMRLKGDLWVLEGFNERRTLFDRLLASLRHGS